MTSSKTVIINLMVDTTRNRVVFADCGGDFVDIILSYLTLPMSSIIRLIGKDDIHSGSISNVYGSVLSLENHFFRNEACKSLLLRPVDAAVSKLHSSLAIGVEISSETRSLFYCEKCVSTKKTVCLYSGAKCSCDIIMNRSVSSRIQNGIKGAVFVKENFRYIVTDDFMISKASTDSVIALLQNFSISDRSRMEKREVKVKFCHVLHLLKCCLVSHDALLSDTFLNSKETINRTQPPEEIRSHVPGTQAHAGEGSSPSDTIKLKLLVNKFDKKLIHAETNEEFVNLLFSILCIPVGCIVMLSNGQINFGCFQNIHKSVESLHTADCIENRDMVIMLTSPKSPPFSTIKNGQLIKLEESNPEILSSCDRFPSCYLGNGIELDHANLTCFVHNKHRHYSVSLHDPKQYPASESTTGFLNKSSYIISDDLSIKPLSGISVASNFLNGAVEGGVEFITVGVGPQQAHALLRASITSKTALTDVFLRNGEGAEQQRWKRSY